MREFDSAVILLAAALTGTAHARVLQFPDEAALTASAAVICNGIVLDIAKSVKITGLIKLRPPPSP
jgi:hypothetical protein